MSRMDELNRLIADERKTRGSRLRRNNQKRERQMILRALAYSGPAQKVPEVDRHELEWLLLSGRERERQMIAEAERVAARGAERLEAK